MAIFHSHHSVSCIFSILFHQLFSSFSVYYLIVQTYLLSFSFSSSIIQFAHFILILFRFSVTSVHQFAEPHSSSVTLFYLCSVHIQLFIYQLCEALFSYLSHSLIQYAFSSFHCYNLHSSFQFTPLPFLISLLLCISFVGFLRLSLVSSLKLSFLILSV